MCRTIPVIWRSLPDALFALLCSQVYKSTNWTTWTLGNQLVSHNGTGMWECVDFFPVAQNNLTGLPLNALAGDQTGLTYVIKSSLNDFRYVIWPSNKLGLHNSVNDNVRSEMDLSFASVSCTLLHHKWTVPDLLTASHIS